MKKTDWKEATVKEVLAFELRCPHCNSVMESPNHHTTIDSVEWEKFAGLQFCDRCGMWVRLPANPFEGGE